MVNQALRMKITDGSEKEEEKKEENTRDRSVPDGSDNEEDSLLYFGINIMTGTVPTEVTQLLLALPYDHINSSNRPNSSSCAKSCSRCCAKT